MTSTAIFVMIFLIAFVLIAGLVMFLSRTIEHGEARFDANGKMMAECDPEQREPARPVRRIEQSDTAGEKS
jgi:hypothetical protein